MTDTVTIQLSKPIASGETTLTSLTFKEATAGDACRADAVTGDFSKMLAILCGMAGVTMPVMQKISMRDVNKIVAEVGYLMGEQPQAPAGSTS